MQPKLIWMQSSEVCFLSTIIKETLRNKSSTLSKPYSLLVLRLRVIKEAGGRRTRAHTSGGLSASAQIFNKTAEFM